MKFLNLNALQTYLTLAIGLVMYLLVGLGCTQTAAGVLDCSQSTIIGPKVATFMIGAIIFAKTVVLPAIQPGGWFRNLFEPKVPVSASGDPGTVTQAQVESGPKK